MRELRWFSLEGISPPWEELERNKLRKPLWEVARPARKSLEPD
jgi:hypothetical protein